MARLRLQPHLEASPEAVEFGPWWQRTSGGQIPLGDLLEGWDYSAEVTLGTTVSVSAEDLLRSTGLDTLADIDIVLMAECPASKLSVTRIVPGAEGLSKTTPQDLTMDLPAGRLAMSLRLSTHLVTSHERTQVARLVPKGSRLLSSSKHTLMLEGEASRFPTEVVDFVELNLPADVPWTLKVNFEDFNSSFVGGVRLLVNSGNPTGQRLIDRETGKPLAAIVRAEIVRTLVATAASRRQELEDLDLPEGSVGGVLASMCKNYLNMDLLSAVDLHMTNAARLEMEIHRGLRPWSEVFE